MNNSRNRSDKDARRLALAHIVGAGDRFKASGKTDPYLGQLTLLAGYTDSSGIAEASRGVKQLLHINGLRRASPPAILKLTRDGYPRIGLPHGCKVVACRQSTAG